MSDPAPELKYDVVIFELATGVVDSIAGINMRYDTGTQNAVKRLETVTGRLNNRYSASIVPAEKYKKGDTLEKGDR